MTTSLDPQWDPEEKWDIDFNALLPFVDVFLPNETEIKLIANTGSIEDAIDKLKPFCNIIVVKNGVNGAIMWDGSKACYQTCISE